MFYEKYMKTTIEKGSYININLDPALPQQRTDNVISSKHVSEDDGETLLNFSLDIIEEVSDYSCSVKLNTQYYLGHTDLLRKITEKIHEEGMLAILDHKLNDIGASNNSALYWIQKMSFDAFTFSPFAGNIQKTVEKAHERELGVIVLTLMSNPEAEELMVKTSIGGQPYYLHIANIVRESGADGCVVGLTCFVEESYIKNIQEVVGERVVFLLQGLGPQGGEAEKIKNARNPLISLGRAVIYSEDPRKTIQKYHRLLKTKYG